MSQKIIATLFKMKKIRQIDIIEILNVTKQYRGNNTKDIYPWFTVYASCMPDLYGRI